MTRRMLVVLGLVLGAGCFNRAHLTDSYGRATRAAFTTQAANPSAGRGPHKLPGLSAHEAKIVLNNYDRAHIAKGASTIEDQGMLILAAPDKAAQQPYLPPPSTPQERR
jgi:type IV pilus biogenesis protein CpaD/CtpE